MSGLAVMLLVLGASAPLRTPDLQVEAATAAGVELPDLADAVARALVAGGVRVVLRGPGSGPCEYCAKVKLTETGPGIFQIEVRHREHAASTTVRVPGGSPLFDRARAIAIEARQLVIFEPDSEAKRVAPRSPRKAEGKVTAKGPRPSEPPPAVAAAVPAPPAVRTREPLPALEQTAPLPAPEPAASDRPVAPLAATTDRGEAKASDRESDAKPPSRTDARPEDRTQPRPAGRGEASAVSARAQGRGGPAMDLAADRGPAAKPRWPWIPTAVGAGAAVAAGICALVARDRYSRLSDKKQPYDSAVALKSQGENWQIASFVLAGVAVAGVATGIVGFATRSSRSSSVAALVSPVPGGGMLAVAGSLP